MKKPLFVILLAWFTALTAAAQFTLNGLVVAHDSRTGTFLCSVPDTVFGHDYGARITLDKEWEELRIGNHTFVAGDSVTFDSVGGGKTWPVLLTGDGKTWQGTITFTSQPIVMMTGNFGYDYTPGTVRVVEPGRVGGESLSARVKWRGGTTNSAGKHKRNYHIKFIDDLGDKQDHSFLGLREDNSWIMDAGQVDMGRVRNRVATDLWLDMASKPYYHDKEPNALTGVRGTMVEVFVNGAYNGIYNFSEAMDRKQLKLKKYKQEQDSITLRGQLWKVKSWTRTASMYVPENYDNDSDTWDGIEVKYPDFEEIQPTDWTTLHRATQWMATVRSTADFDDQAHEYFDMPVIIDYIIFHNVLNAIDNLCKNIYWFCYDRTKSEVLSLAVWDLDTTVGQNWTDNPLHPANVGPTNPTLNGEHRLHSFITDPQSKYYPLWQRRYHELRNTLLRTDSLKARYARCIQALIASGAARREEQRWSGDTDVARHEINLASELEYIEQWIDRRMEYLDTTTYNTNTTVGDVNADGEISVADLTVLADLIMSETQPAASAYSPLERFRIDVNGDGEISVADLTALVSIIMNTTPVETP